MFDHVEINVSDLEPSRRFFEAALAPLGYEVSFVSPTLVVMGAEERHDFGLVLREPVSPAVHLAFEARIARPSAPSTRPRSRPGARTTARPAFDPTTASTTTPRSCSARTATTSRP